MTIKPFNEKAAAVWGSSGTAYETIAQQCLPAIGHAVDRLDPHARERILDVGTGTGRAAREVAVRGAMVTAIDIAEGMLAVAREASARTEPGIDFRLADAEALPFDDASFDGVISTFGVMFSVEPQTAATELARVLRPGGRVTTAAWTPDSNAVLMRQVLAPFAPPPPEPAPPAPWTWGTRDGAHDYLGADFDLEHETGVLYLRYRDSDTFRQRFFEAFGPVKAVAEALDANQRQELAQSLGAWGEPFRDELGVAIPCEYLLTRGWRKHD